VCLAPGYWREGEQDPDFPHKRADSSGQDDSVENSESVRMMGGTCEAERAGNLAKTMPSRRDITAAKKHQTEVKAYQ
jgi:hypothetical protein